VDFPGVVKSLTRVGLFSYRAPVNDFFIGRGSFKTEDEVVAVECDDCMTFQMVFVGMSNHQALEKKSQTIPSGPCFPFGMNISGKRVFILTHRVVLVPH